MNRTLILAAAAVFTCALAFGQSPAVSLQNQEDSTFYYVIDPKELAGLSAGSPLLASKVAAYLSTPDAGTTFASLAPQAEEKLTGLTEGAHLLVGFFAQLDADDFPVRVVALQADSSVGERFYAVFATPAQLNARRGVGKLAQFSRPAAAQGTTVASNQIAGAAESGQSAGGQVGITALPAIAVFSPAYDPSVFSRESNAGFTVLPISESRAWTQTGTRIASVQGTLDSAGLKLVLNVPGGFSSSVSYFLYVFDTRAAGRENPLTMEIEPLARSDRGACILWQKGSDPRLLGTVITSATAVELDVGTDDLASGVLAAAGNTPTVDLTAGWFDRALGIWEEFYYTTFPVPIMGATR
jgi:hypothetical protein